MDKRRLARLKRHCRIKLKMHGTAQVPRLVIHRSLRNLDAQIIDDVQKKTLFSLSTFDKEIKQKFKSSGNIKAAEFFGDIFASKAKEKGITKLIFDRAGYLYHGRVKAFAQGLRKGGMEF